MTTDRELLEAAAKAAGINLRPMIIKPAPPDEGDGFIGYMVADPEKWTRGWFDPLSSDGDALQLAVRLRIDIRHFREFVDCEVNGGDIWPGYDEKHHGDRGAATRYAIVRAAAEIGADK